MLLLSGLSKFTETQWPECRGLIYLRVKIMTWWLVPPVYWYIVPYPVSALAGLSVCYELLPDLCTAVLSGVGVTSPGPGLSTNQHSGMHTLISSRGVSQSQSTQHQAPVITQPFYKTQLLTSDCLMASFPFLSVRFALNVSIQSWCYRYGCQCLSLGVWLDTLHIVTLHM